MKVTRTLAGSAALTVLCLAGLTGCGGGGSDSESPDSTSSSAPGGGMPGMDGSQLAAIQKCLDAAGIDTQLPSDMPSDMPTDVPSDLPTERPSNMPGGGAMLNDPDVTAALEACGIDLPAAPGGGQ